MTKRHNDLKLSTAVDNLFVSFATKSLFLACELPGGSLECIHREKQKDVVFCFVLVATSFQVTRIIVVFFSTCLAWER